MSKHILYLFFLCVFVNEFSYSQKLEIKNSDIYHFRTDSILKKIQEINEFAIIGANINPGWGLGFDKFYILTKSNNQWYSINYSKFSEPIAGHTFFLDTVSLSQTIQDSIFKVFEKSNFWNITSKMNKCIEDINVQSWDSIHCMPSDASTQQVITFYNHTVINVKEYYASKQFQECCPFNLDRDIFIKAFRAILVLKKDSKY